MGGAILGYHALQRSTNATNPILIPAPSATIYTSSESRFVSAIVGAAAVSALSVILLLLINFFRPPSHLGNYTHIPVIFGSLIVANLLQSIGTIMNSRWVSLGGVSPGTLCSLQGRIKQTGNVGTAVWTLILALHAFRLLYVRTRVYTRRKWLILFIGWLFVVFVASIGPLVNRNTKRGPYFGPSGFWCWITDEYTVEQVCLEYMMEWISAFLSFVLYVAVLLRVRGNIIRDTTGKWSLRWVPRRESWQLAFARDYLDSSTIKMATIIVWYPVIYTVLVLPISIARFAGHTYHSHIPVTFTLLADFIFALEGFANLMLFLGTRRLIPDVDTIPDLSTPRSPLDRGSLRAGITPFVLPPRDAAETEVLSLMTLASDKEVTMSWFAETRPRSEMRVPSLSAISHESTQPLYRDTPR